MLKCYSVQPLWMEWHDLFLNGSRHHGVVLFLFPSELIIIHHLFFPSQYISSCQFLSRSFFWRSVLLCALQSRVDNHNNACLGSQTAFDRDLPFNPSLSVTSVLQLKITSIAVNPMRERVWGKKGHLVWFRPRFPDLLWQLFIDVFSPPPLFFLVLFWLSINSFKHIIYDLEIETQLQCVYDWEFTRGVVEKVNDQ